MRIEMAHGGGGRRSAEFLREEILPRFGDGPLQALPDGARIEGLAGPLVFATDSFVVSPPEFPGGDIGALAVHGTVNDVAAAGGRARWLSLALILEEGLPLDLLRRVLDGVRRCADDCGVTVATGDTKVVPRGRADLLYIATAGFGPAWPGLRLDAGRLRPDDAVLASGTLGDHGMAIMSVRNALAREGGPRSDTGPVHRLVEAALPWAEAVRFMRDPTRGGCAAALNEMVEDRAVGVRLVETDLPFDPAARAVAELLGLDLLQSASEGRLLLVCAPAAADAILAAWRRLPEGRGAARIGRVTAGHPGRVALETTTGGDRLVDRPRGELLPRIC